MILALLGGWVAAALLVFELRRRSALLADAAHELRGPVTALSLGLEALRHMPVARRPADALLVELGRVRAAVDDVAAAARGRRAAPHAQEFDLKDLVERSADAWRPAAQRRGGRVLVEWPARHAPVRADPRRLAQVFGNVLANAIEHGGAEVAVRGRWTPVGLSVEVADRGPSDLAPASARHGRGRGLAIAERAIREAGGRLEALERRGGGRTVKAELPFERAR